MLDLCETGNTLSPRFVPELLATASQEPCDAATKRGDVQVIGAFWLWDVKLNWNTKLFLCLFFKPFPAGTVMNVNSVARKMMNRSRTSYWSDGRINVDRANCPKLDLELCPDCTILKTPAQMISFLTMSLISSRLLLITSSWAFIPVGGYGPAGRPLVLWLLPPSGEIFVGNLLCC